MATRSRVLAQGNLPAVQLLSGTSVYSVPAGTVVLLKSAYVSTLDATTINVKLFLQSQVFVNVGIQDITQATPWSWSGWAALEYGHAIYLSGDGGSVNYWLSGAVLPLPGAF